MRNENLSQRFVGEIRTKGTGAELSKRLYAILVKPVTEAATVPRHIIAPDAILNLLPFEALRDAQGEYLLKSRVISYVPSGTILNALRHAEKQKSAPKPLLAVGDVEYENQGGAGRRIPTPASIRGRIERGIADLSGIGLHDLPETRAEVQEIGKIVGSDAVMLLGKDATEAAFKKQPLHQFRILHLAVHGFADTQYPERSALVLGADPQSGDDGLLQVGEIIRLRSNAELTTLSACDSGVGKLQGARGHQQPGGSISPGRVEIGCSESLERRRRIFALSWSPYLASRSSFAFRKADRYVRSGLDCFDSEPQGSDSCLD